jgi:hypothetical protein
MKSLIVAVFVVSACGSSAGGSGGAGGTGGGPCTITISGATQATLTCQASSLFDGSHNRGSVTLSVPNAAPLSSVVIDLARPGEVMTGMWANTDSGAMGGIDVIASNSQAWSASQASPNSQGSYTMDLTAANVIGQTTSAKTYLVHGTIDATLPPIAGTGATGNVTFHASF